MTKLKINHNNEPYYTDEFKKGFECGVTRQYEKDLSMIEDIKAEIKDHKQLAKNNFIYDWIAYNKGLHDALAIIDKHISGKEK